MRPDDFWSYSLKEISDIVESYCKMEQRKFKDNASSTFMLARLIGNQVSKIMDTEDRVSLLMEWDLFPTLFEHEKKDFETNKEAEELEQFKEKRRFMAMRHNHMLDQAQETE